MKKLLFLFLIISTTAIAQEKKTILIFGDSISAGYGVEPDQAFPAHIQQKIDSLGLSYEVLNGGLSGETSAGGLRRISWVLQRDVD
ncbi:MAG: arylesterase, partial [Balneolaceae bacterium]